MNRRVLFGLALPILLCSCAQQAPRTPQAPPASQAPPTTEAPRPPSGRAQSQSIAPPIVVSVPLPPSDAAVPAAKESAVYSDQAAYAAAIRAQVRKNLVLPRNVPDSASALVEVVLSDTGAVSALKTLKGSGFPAYDAAVRRAIERAQPYPLLALPGQQGPLTMRMRFQMKE